MSGKLHRTVLALCWAVALGTIAYLAYRGVAYYGTPLIERPRHELFWDLKPGGELGRRYGWTGSAMMVLLLAYSLRKRLRPLRRLGPLRVWLDYHILLGVCGPLLVILHSSFKVGGIVALSFWSMIAVALSGVLGRFIYKQIPRTAAGDELTLQQVEELDRKLSRRLVEELGVAPEAVAQLDADVDMSVGNGSGLMAPIADLLLGPLTLRHALRRRRRELFSTVDFSTVDRNLTDSLERALRRKADLRRRLRLWEALRRLFHYWHVFHKPFAVIMYLFMVVHIAVVWAAGYGAFRG